jgi:hypothetical protein
MADNWQLTFRNASGQLMESTGASDDPSELLEELAEVYPGSRLVGMTNLSEESITSPDGMVKDYRDFDDEGDTKQTAWRSRIKGVKQAISSDEGGGIVLNVRPRSGVGFPNDQF